jgi:hypothetical protein
MSADDALRSTSASLQPLLDAYQGSFSAARASQEALHGRLTAVLQTLRDAQGASDEAEVSRLGGAATRVESLRKRLEGVAELMTRVQARLEHLQGAVTAREVAFRGPPPGR